MILNLEEIKTRADILEVVEHFLPLQKSNGMYKALCPFHDERTPSFMISPRKNMFYCFGCGVGGDSFKFVQNYKHLSFEEAVKEVASICRISVLESENKKQISTKLLYEVFENVNNFFIQSLLEREDILEYIKQRGLNEEDIKRFDLGYFSGAGKLARYLTGLGQIKLALKLGIIYEKNGKFFSPLEKRLIFGIRNAVHKIVAFSGRFLGKNENNEAKYINSKESELYKKSFVLYNLSHAKTSLCKFKEVIITEGYFDTIACVKLGFLNAVATCGTAFTLSHLALLLKMEHELSFILCFDKDKAGVNANLKTLKMLFKEGIFKAKVRYLRSKKLKDFGDLLLQENLILNEAYIDIDGFEYFCKMNLKECGEDKDKIHAFFKEVEALINAQANFFLKDELRQKASEYFKCDKKHFELQKSGSVKEANFSLEALVLKNIIGDEEKAYVAKQYLEPFHFKALAKNYEAFLKNDQEANLKIALDESLKELNREDFALCIKELVKSELKTRLDEAKRLKNVSLIIELKQRLLKL
ncbi:DNA primase [Campylobacter sp. MIT 99-7217]|uniref:DNA primase n=1 Tax=Campylobacter sp. MIT 99-7217 TaxID=535091 RepID=UPI00115BE398|nr:DNA primase [Campylobacter sp. MIT 99-7217]TQR31804.1 DNA primase [Campylobacter sp. MIT 99-7217]